MSRLSKILIVLALATVSGHSVGAQELRDKAVTQPLDCAYYLLSKNLLESTYRGSVTQVLFRLGRYDQGLAASKIDNDFSFNRESLLVFGAEQVKGGDPQVARQIVDSVFADYIVESDYSSIHETAALVALLAATSQPEKLRRVIDKSGREDRLRLLIHAAAAYTARRQTAPALAFLDEARSLPEDAVDTENDHLLLDLAELYLKNGQKGRSIEALRRLWKIAAQDDDDQPKLALYRRFYLLGMTSEAAAVWKSIEEPNDIGNRLFRVSVLIENTEIAQAEAILVGVKKAELQRHMYGRQVVKHWLALSKPKVAEDAADQISTDPDDFDQQEAYMLIADYHLSKRDRLKARSVVGKAFARVRTIKFAHRTEDSVGASSGSRKAIYLREIRERLEKLGDVITSLQAVRAIDDPHPRAKTYLAAGLGRFARDHARWLPRKQIDELLVEALSTARRIDADEEEAQIMADYAEALARLRDREGATDKLAELLESRADKSLEGYALLLAGEIFEKYKLPLSDRLQAALTAILEEHQV